MRREQRDDRDESVEPSQSPSTASLDGGYGWVVTTCVAMVNGHSWGISAAYSVFLAHYLTQETFAGATRLQYAFVGSLGVGCTLLISPLVRIAVREIGTRPVMVLGALMQSVSLICASLSTEIWHLFLSQGALFGIGMGLLFVPSHGIISQWFDKRRAFANGIAIAGAGLGGLVYSLGTGAMLQSLGLQWAYRILSIISGVINIACSLFIKTRHGTTESQEAALDLGLLRRKGFMLILAFAWFSMLGYFILIFTLANYGKEMGLSPSQAAMIPALFMLGQAMGRPVIGWAGDSWGRINLTLLATFLTGLLSVIFWMYAKTYGILVIFALLEGSIAGAFWVTVAPIIAGVIGLENLPSGLSLLWVFVALPSTFGTPIALEIVTSTGAYVGAQLLTGLSFIAAAVFLLCLRGLEVGQARKISTSASIESKDVSGEMHIGSRIKRFLVACFRWKMI